MVAYWNQRLYLEQRGLVARLPACQAPLADPAETSSRRQRVALPGKRRKLPSELELGNASLGPRRRSSFAFLLGRMRGRGGLSCVIRPLSRFLSFLHIRRLYFTDTDLLPSSSPLSQPSPCTLLRECGAKCGSGNQESAYQT